LKVPGRLAANCRRTPERAAWLKRLPGVLRKLERRWPLTLGEPFEDASCAWVAPAAVAGGTAAVLKLGMPHMEGEHEMQGLRFWNGDPTVRLLEADDELEAMLFGHAHHGIQRRFQHRPQLAAVGLTDSFGIGHGSHLCLPGGPPEVAATRLPSWGDLEDLIRLMDPQPSGRNVFTAPAFPRAAGYPIEGGHQLGQAIVAAAKAVISAWS